MRKTFLALAAGVLGLVLTGTADARPSGHGHHVRERHSYRHSHAERLHRRHPSFAREQFHWTRRVWDARCNRWIYWEPQLQVYYYWDAPANCYSPVLYSP
jgi:hypothetical protein